MKTGTGRTLIILSLLAAILALPMASFASVPAATSSPPCLMDMPAEHHMQPQECLDISCDRCATCTLCQHCSSSVAVLGALTDMPATLEPQFLPLNIRFEPVYPSIDSPPPRQV